MDESGPAEAGPSLWVHYFVMHTLKLGDFDLTIVTDGTYYLDAGAMFVFIGAAPYTDWVGERVGRDE